MEFQCNNSTNSGCNIVRNQDDLVKEKMKWKRKLSERSSNSQKLRH